MRPQCQSSLSAKTEKEHASGIETCSLVGMKHPHRIVTRLGAGKVASPQSFRPSRLAESFYGIFPFCKLVLLGNYVTW